MVKGSSVPLEWFSVLCFLVSETRVKECFDYKYHTGYRVGGVQFSVGEGRAHRSPTAGGTGMLSLVDSKSPVTSLGEG